jgi:hypothetical protein
MSGGPTLGLDAGSVAPRDGQVTAHGRIEPGRDRGHPPATGPPAVTLRAGTALRGAPERRRADVARSGPPAYAWDWFARQRLLWREATSRLTRSTSPVAHRYASVDARAEALALLRADYPRDDTVRAAVDGAVADLVFLGRTDREFAQLGLHNPPRGLRWWWSALTGEDPDAASRTTADVPTGHDQLSLDDLATMDARLAMDQVHEGYGDEPAP